MENEPLASAPRRVEAYLDQILAPLARRLSPFHQDELRRELREHLWARVESYRELDHSEDEAVTEALRQFGGSEDFLRQWQQEWTKTTSRVKLREVWEAAQPAFCLSAGALLLASLPGLWAISQFYFDGTDWWLNSNTWPGSHIKMFNHAWSFFMLLLLPLLLGMISGRYIPRRVVPGLFTALSLDAGLGAVINGVGGSLWPEVPFFHNVVDIITLLPALWIPVACTSAALRSWWLRRSETYRLA